jgi:hypothetical protein
VSEAMSFIRNGTCSEEASSAKNDGDDNAEVTREASKTVAELYQRALSRKPFTAPLTE